MAIVEMHRQQQGDRAELETNADEQACLGPASAMHPAWDKQDLLAALELRCRRAKKMLNEAREPRRMSEAIDEWAAAPDTSAVISGNLEGTHHRYLWFPKLQEHVRAVEGHHPIRKPRSGDTSKTPDWLILRGTAQELGKYVKPKQGETSATDIRRHVLLVGETKVHGAKLQSGDYASHTQMCSKANIGQLVLLHFCTNQHDDDPMTSSPSSLPVFLSPDRMTRHQTPAQQASVEREASCTSFPQSSPVTARQAALQMAEVEQQQTEPLAEKCMDEGVIQPQIENIPLSG
ncbi:hypothetical protein B0H63DRAFT_526816 [Podospora didyma]|uniref:Uncharacterized protein n=1 Tax=Podospora didyma TaxID=330526 RepID=A0AAE0N6H5_9PEZI|nr:hypothetical protein B0H63DRAFT_526816 [Podospora didyma]